MSLQERLDQDFLQAVKGKDKTTVGTLKMLKSAILNKKIEKKLDKEEALPDDDLVSIIKSEVKKRKDSIESYKEGSRDDLVQSEEEEIAILDKYMPEQMSGEELSSIVKAVVAELEATNMSEFGKVMGAVMGRVKGQADGDLVSGAVKSELA